MNTETSAYKSILKSLSILLSVKVITIISNLIKNKFIAMLMGTSGIGVLGILNSILVLVTSFADLGVTKSAVRDISLANSDENNKTELKNIIASLNLILFLLSCITTLVVFIFSDKLSKLAFNESGKAVYIKFLAVAILFTLLTNGRLAILQGLRDLKGLALATSYGSLFSMVLSILVFYLFGEKGIAMSLAITSIITFLTAIFYLKKHVFLNKSMFVEIKESRNKSKQMIQLGMALMFVSFVSATSEFLLRYYIDIKNGVEDVGLFQAGYTIIFGYFGMIFVTLSTDYFPRLSALNEDNLKIENEVNRQALLLILLIAPLLVLFVIFLPVFIELIYSKEFLPALDYLYFSVFGIVFQSSSQTMGMVLLAKNKSKVFVYSVFIFQTIFLINSILFYTFFGIKGLGVAFTINMILHFCGVQFIIKRLYNITYSVTYFKSFFVTLLATLLVFIIKDISNLYLKFFIGFGLFFIVIFYVYKKICVLMGGSLMEIIKAKIK